MHLQMLLSKGTYSAFIVFLNIPNLFPLNLNAAYILHVHFFFGGGVFCFNKLLQHLRIYVH